MLMTGKEAFELAFERLFDAALHRFQTKCSEEEREEARRDFVRRFDPQLKFLEKHLKLEQFPEEIFRELEEKITHFSPVEVAKVLASASLVEQMQAALQAIAARQARERLLEYALTQTEDPYGGH